MANLLEGFEALVAGLGTKELRDGLTVEEICLHVGKGDDWVRRKLKLLMAAGRLEVGKKQVQGLDGRQVMVPAYKIKPEKPATAKENRKQR